MPTRETGAERASRLNDGHGLFETVDEEVFGDPEEAICFVDRIHEVKARDGFSVLAWCLLSNDLQISAFQKRKDKKGLVEPF